MDQELIAYLDERFGESSRQIQSLREETKREIATFREETAQRLERLEEKVRHNGVEIEGLRDNIRQVSEGVVGANEKLDTFKAETAANFEKAQAEELRFFRGAFKEINALKTKVFGRNQQKGTRRRPDEV